MECSGRNALRGSPTCLKVSRRIESALYPAPPGGPSWLAPGFVDLQVNGFAGVDYNDPAVNLEDIERSIQSLFSTGVTRFFPTVITGAPEDMRAAASKLARARRE
ncbi:MAG: hypothetical protein ACPL88_05270, partial [Bryobacteraceae bacterium]